MSHLAYELVLLIVNIPCFPLLGFLPYPVPRAVIPIAGTGVSIPFLYERSDEREVSYHLGGGIEAARMGSEVYYYHQDEQLSTALLTDSTRFRFIISIPTRIIIPHRIIPAVRIKVQSIPLIHVFLQKSSGRAFI